MRHLMVLSSLVALPLAAQSVQYRDFRSLPDTGAIARAEAAIAERGTTPDLLLALGLAQAGRMQYREAVATFSRGLAQAPNHVMLLRWRGHRYLSLREFDRAIADLQRGLELDSTCYGCLYHLGIVLFLRGEFAVAADQFRRALPLAPNEGEHAGSIDWWWMSLARAGRATEAQAVLNQHAASVTARNAYYRRIQLYQGAVTPEQFMTAADTVGIDVSTLSYGLGNWYLVRGDTARARDWFRRATSTDGWPAFGFIVAEAELRRMQ